MNAAPALRRAELLRYGILALPLAFAGMPLYLYAPDFYATQHGVSLSVLGIVLLAIRGIDAFQDPLFGVISDRWAQHRRTMMIAAMIVFGAGFAMLFHPPGAYTLAWFALSMILATSAFSFLGINLQTIGGLWASDTHEKTRITTTREAIGLAGLLVAAVLPALFINDYPAAQAFHYVSLIFLAILVLAGGIFIAWLRGHARTSAGSGAPSSVSFRQFVHIPQQLRLFYLGYGVGMLASSIPVVLVIFFIRDRLGAEAYTGLFLTLYFLSGALGMPLWQWLARRTSKVDAWRISMLVAVVSFIWAFFLGEGDIVAYAIICVAAGLALGAELAIPPSLLADALEDKQLRAEAARYFSLLTFLAKLALAVASGVVLPLLGSSSYVPGQESSMESLAVLSFAYALLPCLIKLTALLLISRMNKGGFSYATPSNSLSSGSVADA